MLRRFAAVACAILAGTVMTAVLAEPARAAGSEQYNLTSMCKPDATHGSFRVRNQSGANEAYTLKLVGTTTELTGTAPANTDTLVNVDWTASNNTWILTIAGFNYTKAVGDNRICPQQSQFNLTSLCKTDDAHGQLRVRNQSAYEESYTLKLVGTATELTGNAPANTDTVVQVDWAASNQTWILEIAGFSYTKAIGNNPLCTSPSPAQSSSPAATPNLADTGTPISGLVLAGGGLLIGGALILLVLRRARGRTS